jgi:hypothetical protein
MEILKKFGMENRIAAAPMIADSEPRGHEVRLSYLM